MAAQMNPILACLSIVHIKLLTLSTHFLISGEIFHVYFIETQKSKICISALLLRDVLYSCCRICFVSRQKRQSTLTELAGRGSGGSVDRRGGGAGLDPAEDWLSTVSPMGSGASSLRGFLPVIVKRYQFSLQAHKQKTIFFLFFCT